MLFDRAHQLFQNFLGHHAQQLAHLRVGDIRAAVCARLFEQRHRIAQAAFRRSRHHGKRARLHLQTFLRRDSRKRLGNFLEEQRAKMKMLRTRTNRLRQIFRLRRGHHEDHPVRRLFERFQQRVGSFIGQHVRFVEDHHFVAPARRSVAHHVAQFADRIDPAIRCRVNFDHVERPARRNFAARVAFVAGGRRQDP